MRFPPWWVGFVAGACVLLVAETWAWRGMEERALGLLTRLRGPAAWNDSVRLIAFDEETSLRYGRPAPRALTARVVEALHAAGVGAIAFDIVFDPEARDGRAADERFAAALKEHGRSVLPLDCIDRELSPLLREEALLELRSGTLPAGVTPAASCRFVIQPTRALRGSAQISHFLISDSPSGQARSVLALAQFEDLRLLSLPLATYLAAKGLPLSAVQQLPDRLRVADLDIPVGNEGELVASYRGLPPDSVLSYVRLAENIGNSEPPRFSPDVAQFLRGKHIVFGIVSKSSGDKGYFESGALLPQVALHLAVLSDLLERRPVRELGRGWQIAAVLFASALLASAALFGSVGRGFLSLVTFVLFALAASSVMAGRGLVFYPLGTITAATVAFGLASLVRSGARERDRQVLADAFGAYVDPNVLEHVLEDPAEYLALGGARRTLTVLFSDISGFTAASNSLEPDVVIQLLREYFEEMVSLITAERGRVDKIMGDGILAVFGDPVPVEDHAHRAVRVGLRMQAAMLRLRHAWELRGAPRVGLRVGIATGEVYVGNIGALGKKVEYTVLGRPVNLASRLEHQAPSSGVLVSEETRAACGHAFAFVRFAGLKMKGFAGDQVAYLATGSHEESGSREREPRFSSEAEVSVRLGEKLASGIVENVSLGGLYVRSPLEVNVGSSIHVVIAEGESLDAQVTHVEPGHGFGLKVQTEGPNAGEHVLKVLYSAARAQGAMAPGLEEARVEAVGRS